MSRGTEGRILLFHWERLVGGLWETTISENLNMKFRSNFNHGFANRGCLHCAVLKALHGFKEKSGHKARDMQYFN